MNKPRLFAALLTTTLLLGVVFWLLNRSDDDLRPATAEPLARTTPPPASVVKAPPAPPVRPLDARSVITPKPPVSASVETLLADTSLDNKALMAGLSKLVLDSSLPFETRNEAMSHLLNLSVEDPAPVLLPLIKDAKLPDPLCQRILQDALNSQPTWQADACLAALAHRKDKETLTEAREHLAFLTGADHGDNLAAWTETVARAKTDWK